ncbi:MAG: YaiO family outer membrane beta-barrel protein [Maribacter sp.]
MSNAISNHILWLSIHLFCGGMVAQHQNTAHSSFFEPDKRLELAFVENNAEDDQDTDTLMVTDSIMVRYMLRAVEKRDGDGNTNGLRDSLNKILSGNKKNDAAWKAAIDNEFKGENYYLALGLSNKALIYHPEDQELKRKRGVALDHLKKVEYDSLGWYNVESSIKGISPTNDGSNASAEAQVAESKSEVELEVAETSEIEETLKNTLSFDNSFSVFNEVFDPMGFMSISYKRETALGSIIPRINYSNRFGINGVQLNLDLYPKIAKGMYAYVNYGYSNSPIYPRHRVGGDVYLNIDGGLEFSAGGRFISFTNTDVTLITNSVGYYTGNYYFSLRSYITPSSDNLTSISGNLLVRKYLKSAVNYLGVNVGIGYSPELRQLTSENQILAETLLFLESQRLTLEYQFASKDEVHTYNTTVGIIREEFSFAPGSYFWSFSAGLTYSTKF